MVSKADLGRPPKWLMRMFLGEVFTAASARAAAQRGELAGGDSKLLPNCVVDLIGALAGLLVHPDALRREGEYCFTKTHDKWVELTRGGRHRLTQDDHKRCNALAGSSFYKPIIDAPCEKHNNGVMHTPAGHQNHFWISISDAIKKKMKGCPWQVCLSTIDSALEEKINTIQAKIKSYNASESRKVRQNINMRF